MIRAVIFDIDGVILDSEQLHAEVESEAIKEFGIDISPAEVLRLYSGVHIDKEIEEMAKAANKDIPLDKALPVVERILKEKLEQGVPLIPHVREVLQLLKSKYKLAFGTSGTKFFIESALSKNGILDLFEVSVYGREVENPKPSPEIFLKSASLLGIKPEEAAVIEDSESGFKAAKAAGMLLIAKKAEHNKQKDFSLADYIVEDLREIPKILESLS